MESKRVYEAGTSDNRMVSCDVEAAETLAGLARGSAVCGGDSVSAELPIGKSGPSSSGYPSQDPAIAVQQFCGNTSTVVTGILETNETVSIVPSQSCSTSYPLNSTGRVRQNLSEADKGARRIRRVLANRESARQTIRRRQATYLEFTKKAADLTEENESLKKEKELAIKECNSLKERNEFLKLQMCKFKKSKSRDVQEEPKSSSGGRACTATTSTPFLPYSQPVLVPVLWPPLVPSANVCQLQYASAPDISCSLHCPTQHNNHRGQENCLGSGSPMFVLPVPWLLPCLHSHSDASGRSHKTPSPHQQSVSLSSDHHQSSSNRNMGTDVSNSTKAVPAGSGDQYIRHRHRSPLDLNLRPGRHSQSDDTYDLNNVSAPKHLPTKKNQERVICHPKKPEDVFAATKARRRRKELMRLKNIHFLHHDLHSTDD